MFPLPLSYKLTKNNKVIIKNFSYMTLLQCFVLVAPLLTYPYLINTLGSELYGWVILAQVVASYASLVVGFGFNGVTAKHVAQHVGDSEKISEIVSSVMIIRIGLWLVSLLSYCLIIAVIPAYAEYKWLFLLSFGCTFNELLFPVFYFQGIERMGYITWLTLIIRSVSVVGIFIFVRETSDYLWVPILTGASYVIGGFLSLYVIFVQHKIRFRIPSFQAMKYYFKDAATIFLTDVISTIKDKLNYIIMGIYVPMSQIVIYDLGSKITGLLSKPAYIIATVLYPRIAKTGNIRLFKFGLLCCALCTIVLTGLCYLFLPEIVGFFIKESVDTVPVSVYLLAPLFLGVSMFIAYDFLTAFGHIDYILKSIMVTTCVYVVLMLIAYYARLLHMVLPFVVITVLSYLAELIYRIIVSRKIYKRNENNTIGQVGNH